MTSDDYQLLPMTTNDYPMTTLWLSDDYPMTIRWLSDDYPMTLRRLSDDYPMTIRWLFDDYPGSSFEGGAMLVVGLEQEQGEREERRSWVGMEGWRNLSVFFLFRCEISVSFLPSNFSSTALCTYVSSFCCPVFGGQCFLFSPVFCRCAIFV